MLETKKLGFKKQLADMFLGKVREKPEAPFGDIGEFAGKLEQALKLLRDSWATR